MSRIVMKIKTIICLVVAIAAVETGCEKSDGLETLPFLEKVDDVCTMMDDLEFMRYCYENFDVNDDGKVSMTEANAVRSIGANARTFAGIEYFSNLELFSSLSVEEVDLRYNSKLETLNFASLNSGSVCPIETVDLRYNKELTSILFRNCENLKTVRMPESLPNLSKLDFYGCSSLISIAIPDGVSSIENITFDYCTSLESIKIPGSVTDIGYRAFYTCSSLTFVDASDCKNLQLVGSYVFSGCPVKEFLLGTPIPPEVSGDSFSASSDAILKVPAKSVEAYKNSGWASHFGIIKAL